MSQNSNQNIDDILQQLKSKMNSEDNSGESLNLADIYASTPSETDDMSAADLQNELKNQFISSSLEQKGEDIDSSDEEDGYKLDTDFLNEAQNYETEAALASEDDGQGMEEVIEEETEPSAYEADEELIEDNTELSEEDTPLLDEIDENSEDHEGKTSYEYYRNLSDEDLKLIIDDSEESEEAIWQEEDEAAEEVEEPFEDAYSEEDMFLEDEDISDIEEENKNED